MMLLIAMHYSWKSARTSSLNYQKTVGISLVTEDLGLEYIVYSCWVLSLEALMFVLMFIVVPCLEAPTPTPISLILT
jgi:hypothetical protein